VIAPTLSIFYHMAYSTPIKKRRPASRTPVAPLKKAGTKKKLTPAQIKKLATMFRTALRKEVAEMKKMKRTGRK